LNKMRLAKIIEGHFKDITGKVLEVSDSWYLDRNNGEYKKQGLYVISLEPARPSSIFLRSEIEIIKTKNAIPTR